MNARTDQNPHMNSESCKNDRGTVFRYFLTSGETRWGFIYDGPPKPGRPRNQINKKGFRSERDAIVALHAATTKQDTGVARPLADANQTLSELFKQWMTEYARRKLGRKTVERYQQLADYILPHLGEIAVSKLDLYAFEKIFDDLATHPGKRGKPLSGKTIRNVASVFDSMFKRAVKRYKTLKENPLQGCDLPKLHKRNVETLEPEDIRRFALQSLKEVEWLRPLAALAAGTGARRGEMLGGIWSNINWIGHTFLIDRALEQTKEGIFVKLTKSGDERTIPLPPFVLRELQVHREKQQRNRDLFGAEYQSELDLIFAEPDGSFLKPDSVTAKVCIVMKKLGIKGSLHTLRHSQASELFDVVPLTTISKRLGHSSTRTTAEIYSQATRRRDRDAADIVENLMGEAFDKTRIN
jgi:integrase